jgi:hypothetical protein
VRSLLVQETNRNASLPCRKQATENCAYRSAYAGEQRTFSPRHESLRKVFNTRFLTLCTVLRNSGTPGYNW